MADAIFDVILSFIIVKVHFYELSLANVVVNYFGFLVSNKLFWS